MMYKAFTMPANELLVTSSTITHITTKQSPMTFKRGHIVEIKNNRIKNYDLFLITDFNNEYYTYVLLNQNYIWEVSEQDINSFNDNFILITDVLENCV